MSSVDFVFLNCATGMCNYYFCKHLMKYCRGESYYHTSFSERSRLYILINSQSAANQMIGTCTLHVAHLYWGADRPVSRIISLCQKILIFYLFLKENVCCGYSLEAPYWDTSNEYPQHMPSWRNKKNIYMIPPFIWSYGPWHLKWSVICRTISGYPCRSWNAKLIYAPMRLYLSSLQVVSSASWSL